METLTEITADFNDEQKKVFDELLGLSKPGERKTSRHRRDECKDDSDRSSSSNSRDDEPTSLSHLQALHWITGPPRTGKTSVAQALHSFWLCQGRKVCMFSALTQPLPRHVRTSGSSYGVVKGRGAHASAATAPGFVTVDTASDVYIIDDIGVVSFKEWTEFVSFVRALKPKARVIVVGTAYNLPCSDPKLAVALNQSVPPSHAHTLREPCGFQTFTNCFGVPVWPHMLPRIAARSCTLEDMAELSTRMTGASSSSDDVDHKHDTFNDIAAPDDLKEPSSMQDTVTQAAATSTSSSTTSERKHGRRGREDTDDDDDEENASSSSRKAKRARISSTEPHRAPLAALHIGIDADEVRQINTKCVADLCARHKETHSSNESSSHSGDAIECGPFVRSTQPERDSGRYKLTVMDATTTTTTTSSAAEPLRLCVGCRVMLTSDVMASGTMGTSGIDLDDRDSDTFFPTGLMGTVHSFLPTQALDSDDSNVLHVDRLKLDRALHDAVICFDDGRMWRVRPMWRAASRSLSMPLRLAHAVEYSWLIGRSLPDHIHVHVSICFRPILRGKHTSDIWSFILAHCRSWTRLHIEDMQPSELQQPSRTTGA